MAKGGTIKKRQAKRLARIKKRGEAKGEPWRGHPNNRAPCKGCGNLHKPQKWCRRCNKQPGSRRCEQTLPKAERLARWFEAQRKIAAAGGLWEAQQAELYPEEAEERRQEEDLYECWEQAEAEQRVHEARGV